VKRIFYIREHVGISYELDKVFEQAKAISSTTISTNISRLSSKKANEVKNQFLEASKNTICFDAILMKELRKKLGDDAFFV